MARVIFEELGPLDRAARRGLNALGEGNGGALISPEHGMDMAVICGEAGRQPSDVGDAAAEVRHAQSMGIEPIQCKNQLYGFLSHTQENDSMDIWGHRANFKSAVKRHRSCRSLLP